MSRSALLFLAALLYGKTLAQRPYTLPAHPRNDRWTDVRAMALGTDEVVAFSGDNTGATADNDMRPGSVLDREWGQPCVWHAFTTEQAGDVTVSFCGSTFQQPGAFVDYLFVTRPDGDQVVQAATIFPAPCADGNYAMRFPDLPPGTYYIAVGYLSSVAEGSYLVTVSAKRTAADMVTR